MKIHLKILKYNGYTLQEPSIIFHSSINLHMQLKYGHEFMMANTSLRWMNSVSESGKMFTPMNANSSGMKLKLGIDNYGRKSVLVTKVKIKR